MRNRTTGKFEKLSDELYLGRVKDRFGDTFLPEDIRFVNNNVIVVCKEHGEFTKNKHDFLRSKGCPVCARKKTTLEVWIKASHKKHNNKFDYSLVQELEGQKHVPIICPEHGIFYQNPIRHKSGANGCNVCSLREVGTKRRKTQEKILSEFAKVHGNNYDYSKVVYTDVKQKVDIICRTHGVFKQTPDNHLQGQGCLLCGFSSPFKKTGYIEKCRKTKGLSNFYILLCENTCEKFLKLGITNVSVERRYNKKNSMPYSYTKLAVVKGDAGLVWQLERDLLRLLVSEQHTPKLPFQGMTECVKFDLTVINDALDNLLHSDESNTVARKVKVELLKHFPCLAEVI